MSIPNDPNPVDLEIRDQLSQLRKKFLNGLIALVDQTVDGKPVIPSPAEMTVIRGVLRDNNMVINGNDGTGAIGRALQNAKEAGLPEFDDDEDEG